MENTSFNVPTGRANNRYQNAFATASSSGNSNSIVTNNRAQARKDQNSLECLLVMLFAWLLSSAAQNPPQVQDAFTELTEVLRRYVFRILTSWRAPNAWHLSEDVIQTVFMRLLSRSIVKQYAEHRSTRSTYLFGIVRNVMYEEFRKLRPGKTSPLMEDLVDPAPRPDEALAMCEIRDQLHNAIDRLSPRMAHALRAQYGLEEPSKELLGLSTVARHSRTCRARAALCVALSDLTAH